MLTMANKKLFYYFIGIELILYFTFIILDVFGVYSTSSAIKFVSILLCLVMSIVIQLRSERFLDRVMLSIALSFTVFADIFLLFTDYYVIGVCCFCVVQTLYLVRIVNMKGEVGCIEGRIRSRNLYRKGKRLFLEQFIKRILISSVIVGILLVIKFPVDMLFSITTFYFISFICNIILVYQIRAKSHYFHGDIRLGLFWGGLVLFFCCDIMVGIFNAAGYVPLQEDIYRTLYQVSSIGMWVFYLPGQVMITLS